MKDILTLQEVATYLQLSDKTVLKMVKEKEIPCAKIANQWRFSRAMVEDWINSKMEVIPQNDFSRLVEKEYDFIRISRLVDEDSIIMDLKATDSRGVIEELSQKAYENEYIANKDEFIKRILDRESLTSTSIGQGIALPHLRKPSCEFVTEPKIVIGFSKDGIDFASLDGEKTTLFLLLLSDSEVVHLRILSRLTRVLANRDMVERFKTLKNPRDVVAFFIEVESKLTPYID